MSVASRIGDRFKFAFVADLINAVTGALLAITLARLLDPDAYGLLFLLLSTFTIGKLLSIFGIPKSASRFIAEYKEKDIKQSPNILKISFVYNLFTITLVCIVFITFRKYIGGFIGAPESGPIWVLGCLFIIFGTFTSFIIQAFQGFEDILVASSFKILHKVGRLIFVVGLVFAGFKITGALAGYVLSSAIVSISGLLYLYITKVRGIESTAVESGLYRRVFNYSLPIAFTQSSHVIDNHIDKVLLGFFAGPAAVGFYTVGKQVVQMTQTPMSALGFTISPTYGAKKAKGDTDTAARIFESALSHSLLVYIPAAAGLVLVAEPTVELIFGAEYVGAVPVLQVLSIFIVLQSVTNLTSHGLDFLGRARARAIVKGISAVSNVFLNILLIPEYGAVGAAAATVLTFSLYTFVNVVIMHHELGFRVRKLLKYVAYSVAVTAIMSAVVLLTLQYITGLVTLFAVVGIGASVWFASVFAFGLIDIEEARVFIS